MRRYVVTGAALILGSMAWFAFGPSALDSGDSTSGDAASGSPKATAHQATAGGSAPSQSGGEEGAPARERGKREELDALTSLTVRIRGVVGRGTVRLALFAQPEGFPHNADLARVASAPAAESSVEVTMTDLAPGRYAIAVFQDLNEDRTLNKNFLGIPSEPYGFTNNSRGRLGPPSFAEAAFQLPHERGMVDIQLR